MKLGKYSESVRTALTFHLKAWCLLIEDSAGGIEDGYLEEQLFSLDSGGRQWHRWKTGQIPSIDEFEGATSAAITCKWIDAKVAEALLRSFSIQRETSIPTTSRSSYDQASALGACYEYAEAHDNEELLQHCNEWNYWVHGPDPKSPEFAGWMEEKSAGWDIEEGELLEGNIESIVSDAITQIYEMGVDDPFSAIVRHLRLAQKAWPEVKAMMDEDLGAQRNRKK